VLRTGPVLLAAVARREWKKKDDTIGVARTVTVVDQATGRTDEFDVDDKRVNGELDEALHSVVVLELSHGRYWNDTPQGRRPQTVVRVTGVAAAA
jgi:hypothetical protein